MSKRFLARPYPFQEYEYMRGWIVGFLPLVLSAELLAQGPSPASTWSVTLGAAAIVGPRYPGADEYRVLPLPLVQITYNNRFFLGAATGGSGPALGMYAIRTPRVTLAAGIGIQDSRSASRSDALAGTADWDVAATASGSLSYRTGPVEWQVGASQGISGGSGFLGTARVSTSWRLGRFVTRIGFGATAADATQMRREFGVTELEADRRQALIDAGDSRLQSDKGHAYRPAGGLRSVGGSLSLGYLLSARWSIIGLGGIDRLSDRAAESPLVRRREQYSGAIGLGYRI